MELKRKRLMRLLDWLIEDAQVIEKEMDNERIAAVVCVHYHLLGSC